MKTLRAKDGFPIYTGNIIYLIDKETLNYKAGVVTAISYRDGGEVSITFLPPHTHTGQYENISFEIAKMRTFQDPKLLAKELDTLHNGDVDVTSRGSLSPPSTAPGTPKHRWREEIKAPKK